MKISTQKAAQDPVTHTEPGVRPLARMKARELTPQELERIAGAFATGGLSNCGGFGDHDLQN